MTLNTTDQHPPTLFHPDPLRVAKLIRRRSFCMLASTSPAGRPHAAGAIYQLARGSLYVSTMRDSRKGRNIAANPHVGVFIPIRRLPIGPPSSVQFQADAELYDADDPHIVELHAAGELPSITKHGEMDLPGGCFVRITPPARINTYALGMSLWKLLRDPIHAAGSTEFAARLGEA